MTRAVVPRAVPPLPPGATGWARSTKRAGSMYHAHFFGVTLCGRMVLDRHRCEAPDGLGDFRYFGVCPQCFKLSDGGAA